MMLRNARGKMPASYLARNSAAHALSPARQCTVPSYFADLFTFFSGLPFSFRAMKSPPVLRRPSVLLSEPPRAGVR